MWSETEEHPSGCEGHARFELLQFTETPLNPESVGAQLTEWLTTDRSAKNDNGSG